MGKTSGRSDITNRLKGRFFFVNQKSKAALQKKGRGEGSVFPENLSPIDKQAMRPSAKSKPKPIHKFGA